MGRPTGLPKTGGRVKGTPNKRSTHLATRLEESGFDPLSELLKIFPDFCRDRKASVLLSLLSYLYPKRKPVDPVDMNEVLAELSFVDEDDQEIA